MTYGSQIWGQYVNTHVQRIIKLQDKSIRIINFADYHAPTTELYKSMKILKLKDNITLNNYLYVHDSLSRRIPSPLQQKFTYIQDKHSYCTRNSDKKCVNLPISRTIEYGIHSITSQSARSWTHIQIIYQKDDLHISSRNQCKQKIKLHFIDTY